MEIIAGLLLGFFVGYMVCMGLASLEMHLARQREAKNKDRHQDWLELNQQTIVQQNLLIERLIEDSSMVLMEQQRLTKELEQVKQQYERTLALLN